jgi:hypothetical protein
VVLAIPLRNKTFGRYRGNAGDGTRTSKKQKVRDAKVYVLVSRGLLLLGRGFHEFDLLSVSLGKRSFNKMEMLFKVFEISHVFVLLLVLNSLLSDWRIKSTHLFS